MFAKIGFINPGIDKRLYTYRIPDNLQGACLKGSRVNVDFAGKRVWGIVIYIETTTEYDEAKIKNISHIENENFNLSLDGLQIAEWMVEAYHCGWGSALKCLLPPGINSKVSGAKTEFKKHLVGVKLCIPPDEIAKVVQKTRSKGQETILRLIEGNAGFATVAQIVDCLENYLSPLNSLCKKGIIEKIYADYYRSPELHEWAESSQEKVLNNEQQAALDAILEAKADDNRPFLLHGVTGSGKTEIYLRLIENCIKNEQQAILLVPEIALTTQNVGRVLAKFKTGIAVMHSRMAAGERIDQWRMIQSGHAQIVIGARSAIFAPFKYLGLIILDEEHESSYRQDCTPYYRTVDVARKLQALTGAKLLLASATPSYESLFRAEHKEYRYLSIRKRYDGSAPPLAEIVDMRAELKDGNNSVFSSALAEELQNCLDRGTQGILFVGRRGYASFILCRSCGHVVRCESCDVSMTQHNDPPRMLCHYCGATKQIPKVCPQCSSPYIRAFGVGTEKVCDELDKYFPQGRVLRMDSDTTQQKGDYDRILTSFARGEADFLVGTQMVIKGHDFPNVSLAAVINADTLLHFPDYRSSERSLQQLTQAAGRAGRGIVEGKVIVQTYFPKHVALQALQRNDYNYAYGQEIRKRKILRYPPYSNIVRVLLSSLYEDKVSVVAKGLAGNVGKSMALTRDGNTFSLHGPAPSPISKVNRFFRWQFFIKIPERQDLNYLLALVEEEYKHYIASLGVKDVSMIWELNPDNIL